MTRQQIFLSVASLLLIIALYQLPRVVINNETPDVLQSHELQFSVVDRKVVDSLKSSLKSPVQENYINFAHSLAKLYLKYGIYDSAVYYTRQILEKDSSLIALDKVSTLIYPAFVGANTQTAVEQFADLLQPMLDTLVKYRPNNLEYKNMLGMVLVTSSTPMSGISLLREVVDEDPDNRNALINLGLLAIRSNQYDRGLRRFERLIEMDQSDYEAMLYAAVCLIELDSIQRVNTLLNEIVASEEADPALKVAAQQYLDKLVQ